MSGLTFLSNTKRFQPVFAGLAKILLHVSVTTSIFEMVDLCEQMKQLRLHSQKLLPRVYELVGGLSKTKHKAAATFMDDHSELVSKLARKFPDHPNSFPWDKVDKHARAKLNRNAERIVACLNQEYFLFEDMVIFQDQALRLLGDLNQRVLHAAAGDGPNEVVCEWMALFCELVCLHLLSSRTPRKATMQVYIAAHSSYHHRDPPNSPQIVNFILTFAATNPIGRLQSEFSRYGPRVRQILENLVWPVLSRYPSALEACSNGFFSFGESTEARHSEMEVTNEKVTEELRQCLSFVPEYQNWVLCGSLVCPGVLRQGAIRSAVKTMLSSNWQMQLVHEQCERIHPLFEQLVKPVLQDIYKAEAKGIKEKEKRGELKASIRELVEGCRISWEKNGWVKRKADRVALLRECRRVVAWAKANPDEIHTHLSTFLGVLSITRHEILWYFREVGGTAGSIQNSHPLANMSGREKDPVALALIDAHVQLQTILLSYRTSICKARVATIQKQLREELLPDMETHMSEVESEGDAVGFLLVQLRHLVELMKSISEPSAEQGCSFWVWDEHADFADTWRAILMSVLDRHGPFAGGCLVEGDGADWFKKLERLVVQTKQIGHFINAVSSHSSLQELCYYQTQIQSLLRYSMDVPAIEHANPMMLLHVFSQFLKNDQRAPDPFRPQSTSKFVGIAESCSKELTQTVTEKIKKLVVSCLRAMEHEMRSNHYDMLSSTSSDAFQSLMETESFDTHWRKLSNLVAAFSDVGQVQVTSRLRFSPELYLVDAVSGTFRAALTRQVFKGHMLQLPSSLEREHRNFLTIANALQAYTPFDIVNPLQDVRSSLIGVPHAAGQGAPPIVPSIAEWYISNIIRDLKSLSITFSPGRRRFESLVGEKEASLVAACGELSELRGLICVFGTGGVKQLATHWGTEVKVILGQLEKGVKTNAEVLGELSSPCESPDSWLDFNKAHLLCGRLKNLKTTVEVVQKLSRALALRQLLSEAYCSVLEDRTEGTYRHGEELGSSDLVDLPGPGYGSDASPSSADPALVACLTDMVTDGSVENFLLLPALFAGTLSTLTWTVSSFDPDGRMFQNGMHQLTFCIKALALALEEGVEKGFQISQNQKWTLKAGLAFQPAPAFIQCFAKIAASLVLRRSEPSSVMNARFLLMDTLCCHEISREQLEKLGFPMSRLRSAYEQSVLTSVLGG